MIYSILFLCSNRVTTALWYLIFNLTGDLQNEDSVLEWLIDDDNRELADEIESVNDRMLERLLEESPFLAVFFCKFKNKKNFIYLNLNNCITVVFFMQMMKIVPSVMKLWKLWKKLTVKPIFLVLIL